MAIEAPTVARVRRVGGDQRDIRLGELEVEVAVARSGGEVALTAEEDLFAVARRSEARAADRIDVLDVVLRWHAAEPVGLHALPDQRVAVLLAAGAGVHGRVA